MLTKLRVVPFIVLLLTPLASAFQEAAPWRNFSSPEGKFTVLVPTEPKAEVREVESKVGKLTLYSYASSTKGGYFMSSYGDYPNEPTDAAHAEQVLEDVHAGVLKSIGGEVISGNKIVLKRPANSGPPPGNYPGRWFTAKKTLEGSEVYYHWRMYLVGRRLYQLAVVTSKAGANSPDVTKFLTSFQLTK